MEEVYRLLDYSYMMEKKYKEKERLLQSEELQEKRIAVLCGSTFGEIKEFLEIFLLYYGIKPIFFVGQYNRFFEEACFPNKALKEFQPDIVFIHMTNKNLMYNFKSDVSLQQILLEDKQRLIRIWEEVERQYKCIVIQNNFEYYLYRIIGNSARTHEEGNVKYIDDVNNFISSYKKEHKNFYINDIHYLSSYVGLQIWYDERMWNLFKYPMSMSIMPHYAFGIANIIKSIFGKNKKAIVLDLDNTLWGGAIGEIGAENIKLGIETPQGESFAMLHRYLKYLARQGVILSICSKNEYDIGISGLQSAKSVLREEDFAIKKINWKNKYENIKEILQELNLPEDAVIFIDDSPVECDSVGTMIPGIETLQIGDVNRFVTEMDIRSFFEITTLTGDDEKRNQYYKDNATRNGEKKKYENYDEFLKELGMVCYVHKIHDKNIERVMQLLNKTNQFNFLTKRYTLDEIRSLNETPEIKILVLELEDKFGSNGIVSVSIIRFEGQEAYIDGWVMSCRVFDRDLETVMLKLICETCQKRDIHILHGYYRETKKNKKIALFFKQLGFKKGKDDKESKEYEWVCTNVNELLKKCNTKNITIKSFDY